MTKPTRVMVVDDSALYRKVITDVLSEDPNIDVVGTAPNGRIALMKIPQCSPDLITLDMEMPEMDGLTTLTELSKKYPEIKSIVFSHHTEKGANLTLKALSRGAVDFLTKPVSGGSLEDNLDQVRGNLLPKVSGLAGQAPKAVKAVRQSRQKIRVRPLVQLGPREVIAIGISTGGPNSLMEFFEQLPKSLPQALLIVQHMPAIFTRKLAEQLSRVGTIPVHEAVHGEPVVAGKAYLAPGDYHMEVAQSNGQKIIQVKQGPPENYCRPAVDVLFRSVAEVYGQRAVGAIMTGMGHDGHKGSKVMKAAGAPIVAQDEATSVVWGMPRFIVENDLADRVSPLDRMFESISSFIL